MATLTDLRRVLARATSVKRVYYVAGSSVLLRERAVDTIRAAVGATDIQRVTVDIPASGKDRAAAVGRFWDEAFQASTTPRLVCARGAEALPLDRISDWLDQAGARYTTLIFISAEPGTKSKMVGGRRDRKRIPGSPDTDTGPLKVIKTRGTVVLCPEPSWAQAVAELQAEWKLPEETAEAVLTRTGDFPAADNVAAKLFRMGATERTDLTVKRLTDFALALAAPAPDAAYAEALRGNNIARAAEAARLVADEEAGRVIAELDRSLDEMTAIRTAKHRGLDDRNTAATVGISEHRARVLARDMGSFSPQAVTKRAGLLAEVEVAHTQHHRGILEFLAASW